MSEEFKGQRKSLGKMTMNEINKTIDSFGFIDPKMIDVLIAPMKPQKPIYDEAKERELFEAWSADHVYLGGCSTYMHSGEYDDIDVQYSWESWEACAKSRAKPVEVGNE